MGQKVLYTLMFSLLFNLKIFVRAEQSCFFALYTLQCNEIGNSYYDLMLYTGYDQEMKIIRCNSCFLETIEEYMFSKNPKWSLNLNNIEITDNQNQLKLIDTPFRGLESLEWLKLYNSNIDTITTNTFEGIPNLKYLFLQNNNITALPARVFSEIENVVKINLNENKIRLIHKTAFRGLNNLKELQLSGNQIKRLKDGTFDNLKSLQALDLSNNPLVNLHFDKLHASLPSVAIIKIQDMPCSTLVTILLKNIRNYYDIATYSARCNYRDKCLFVKIIRQSDRKSVVISTLKNDEAAIISVDKIGDIPCKRINVEK